MRGFGVLGVDFAIERQMDKGARAAGLGPMEFRLINAYRDGDMKATRQVASNTALVECIKVAAQKANYPLASKYEEMTSMTGASLTEIPETITDSGVLPRLFDYSKNRYCRRVGIRSFNSNANS